MFTPGGVQLEVSGRWSAAFPADGAPDLIDFADLMGRGLLRCEREDLERFGLFLGNMLGHEDTIAATLDLARREPHAPLICRFTAGPVAGQVYRLAFDLHAMAVAWTEARRRPMPLGDHVCPSSILFAAAVDAETRELLRGIAVDPAAEGEPLRNGKAPSRH